MGHKLPLTEVQPQGVEACEMDASLGPGTIMHSHGA